jgi:hypothetical protein
MSEDVTLTVDWADVLKQAVENERWKVLREFYRVINNIPTTKPSKSSYSDENIPAPTYKNALLSALSSMETSWKN